MADAYMSWDVGYAIRCIRAIEDAGIRLRWIEEPVIPDDVAGLARVRAAVETPIAAGEHEATRYGFRDLVEAGAVDVLQPDVNRLGGITEARRVWALGETFGLDVMPHLGFAHNATSRSRASRRRCSSTCRRPRTPTKPTRIRSSGSSSPTSRAPRTAA